MDWRGGLQHSVGYEAVVVAHARASANMVFTLGLRHTFHLCQRGLALVQFS